MNHAPTQRRAFTLAEVVITIGIVVALASLIAWGGSAWSKQAKFDQTLSRFPSAAAQCRNDAERSGEARALVAETNATGIVIASRPLTAEGLTKADVERQVYMTLPGDYHLSLVEPNDDPNRGSGWWLKPQSKTDSETDASPDQPVTLGVYMPDGTVVPGDQPLILFAGSQAARLALNLITGDLTCTRFDPRLDQALGGKDTDKGSDTSTEKSADKKAAKPKPADSSDAPKPVDGSDQQPRPVR